MYPLSSCQVLPRVRVRVRVRVRDRVRVRVQIRVRAGSAAMRVAFDSSLRVLRVMVMREGSWLCTSTGSSLRVLRGWVSSFVVARARLGIKGCCV